MTEEWKWGTGVWSHKRNIVSIPAMKDHVKLHFFKGASIQDPRGLFNAGLDAKATRAIDFKEGDVLRESDLTELIRVAIAYDLAPKK
jgi:hypothetical protein